MSVSTLNIATYAAPPEQPLAPLLTHYDNLILENSTVIEESTATLTIFAPALLLSQLIVIGRGLQAAAIIGPFARHPFSERWDDTVVTAPIVVKDEEALHATIARLAETQRVDICVQRSRPQLHQPGLLVMDMDSTVIQIECIDEIAKLAGVGEQVASVTARAMRGELAFRDSLISRVACLKGVELSQLARIKQAMPLMPGISTLLSVLRDNGWRCTIASGGFTYFAEHLQQRLLLDDIRANALATDNHRLTGHINGPIVDAEYKAQSLLQWQQLYGINTQQVIAMGDGANDLSMMKVAGLGVACHAKPIVNATADAAIRFASLQALLYLMDS